MGYGQELQKILRENKMRVIELSRRTGISATTLYSAITRDSAIRYDYALRIADVLDIDISRICSTVPDVPVTKDPDLAYIIESYNTFDADLRDRLVKYVQKLMK